MPKKPLVWKAEPGTALDSAFSAQFGNLITYNVATRTYGYPAYVEIRDRRGGLKRLDLGLYVKMEQALQACERHCAGGCDLSKAKRITRYPLREGSRAFPCIRKAILFGILVNRCMVRECFRLHGGSLP